MKSASTKPCDIEAWLGQLGLPSADRDYQPGHQRVLHLINALAEQGFVLHQPKFRVRVAGTNGKGSTSHFLAGSLQACGLKVGLYTSPHINTFHERMRVQGEPITQKQLYQLMEIVMPLALKSETSYFETATVLALLHFSMQQVDVEILEAGVGAKLDATTSVSADMGLLTPIGFDHQGWLGDSLEQIAQDKSYVFEHCKYAISVAQSSCVADVLNQRKSPITYADKFAGSLAMMGKYQRQNAGLAWQALKVMVADSTLGDAINLDLAGQALGHANIPGRLQSVSFKRFKFLLDAAHNAHAVEALLSSLTADHKFFDTVVICTREDRDLSQCVPALRKICNKVVVMTGSGQHDYAHIADALCAETDGLSEGSFLILGSFITLGETLAWVKHMQQES